VALPETFWLPSSAQEFKKAPPPKTGPAFGHWAGRDLATMQLPGGGILQMDLNRLTLADYRAMRDHYQINASLSVLQFMLHRIDWHIECSDKKIATAIEENMRAVWTRLIRAMSQAYWAGYSPIAIEYENDPMARDGKGMVVINKFKDMLPEECQVNWKEVEGWSPPNRIPPKYKVYDGIKQVGIQWPIPVENSLWYPLLMENGNYAGKKLLRSAFSSWYFSILIHLYANRYYERFGEPLPIGRAPYDDDVTVDGEAMTGKKAMESILMGLRSRSVVVLPDERTPVGENRSEYSYDIEYLESQMRGADFEKYLTRLDEEITLGLFTPLSLLRAGASTAYNSSIQQMQTYLWMLNALAGDMKEYIDNYVVTRLKDYNFGVNAPRATWEFRQMGKENIETMRAVITELVRGDKAGVDLEELGQAIGLNLHEIRTLTDPNADPNANQPDNGTAGSPDQRTQRDRTDRNTGSGTGQSGVGTTRATTKKVAARIANTITNSFDKNKPIPSLRLGYRREMVESLTDEGWSYDNAASAVEGLYGRLNAFLEDLRTVGSSDAETLVGYFEKALNSAVTDLLDGR
jgi:hypothetical protein